MADKRLIMAVSSEDAVVDTDTNNFGVFSFTSFTLPSFENPPANTEDHSTCQQEMGGCLSKPAVARSVRSEPDGDSIHPEPYQYFFEPALPPKRPATPPFQPSDLSTLELDGGAQRFYSRPEIMALRRPSVTPPHTVDSTDIHGPSRLPYIASHAPNVSTPPESAGSRFWKMLQAERPDYKKRFFEDVFDIRPVTGDKVNNNIISPYYRQGMMAGYIRAGWEDVVKQDNIRINISAMLVNKEFRDAGSRLLYGNNLFSFEDPINCLWWFKHIGEVNFSNVRRLECALRCGWPSLRDFDVSNFDQSQEELWHRVFSWLKTRHQLTELTLLFEKWKSIGLVCQRIAAEYRREELVLWREKIREVLYNFRGLKKVTIVDSRQMAFSAEERNEYTMMMIQDRLSVFPPEPQQRLTLAQFLEQRRFELKMEASIQKSGRAQEKKRKRQEKDEEEAMEQEDVEMDGCGA
ncbi:hypothetical protein PV04_10091 [Phialophora macrospora]|uniref:Uncharacterized protein n=1 Tax=Phialophora macrospora TaxID=1851006 RepID=A0A0D2F5P7_9EURO|nr:hypothetical protein PV04_10091 [Phialophora macrospora]